MSIYGNHAHYINDMAARVQDDKLPNRKMFEVEIADCFIRLLDIAGGMGLDLGSAFEEKMAFNASRADHQAAARKEANGKKY